jgi:hypothetical protein
MSILSASGGAGSYSAGGGLYGVLKPVPDFIPGSPPAQYGIRRIFNRSFWMEGTRKVLKK